MFRIFRGSINWIDCGEGLFEWKEDELIFQNFCVNVFMRKILELFEFDFVFDWGESGNYWRNQLESKKKNSIFLYDRNRFDAFLLIQKKRPKLIFQNFCVNTFYEKRFWNCSNLTLFLIRVNSFYII